MIRTKAQESRQLHQVLQQVKGNLKKKGADNWRQKTRRWRETVTQKDGGKQFKQFSMMNIKGKRGGKDEIKIKIKKCVLLRSKFKYLNLYDYFCGCFFL